MNTLHERISFWNASYTGKTSEPALLEFDTAKALPFIKNYWKKIRDDLLDDNRCLLKQ